MGLTFHGVTSDSLGIIVDGYYAKSAPSRRVTETKIPGRNGSLLQDEGVYENITVSYDIYWLPSTTTDDQVTSWLKQDTYYPLVDSERSDGYRMARVYGEVSVVNHRDCYHSAKVTFDCKPQLFLNTGDTEVSVSSGGTINNPTSEKTLPLITLTCTSGSAGTLTVNGKTISILDTNTHTTVVLDADTQNAYDGATNLNSVISGEFPILSPGSNLISFTGGITSVKMKPRWWTV